MSPQPLAVVRDVEASSRWYQAALGLQSGHGGPEYEQLMFEGRMVLQLHDADAHEHPHLGLPTPGPAPVVLWFLTSQFDAALARIHASGASIIEGPRVNINAQHREVWLCDPDGHVVVVAGPYGDVGLNDPRTPAAVPPVPPS